MSEMTLREAIECLEGERDYHTRAWEELDREAQTALNRVLDAAHAQLQKEKGDEHP